MTDKKNLAKAIGAGLLIIWIIVASMPDYTLLFNL